MQLPCANPVELWPINRPKRKVSNEKRMPSYIHFDLARVSRNARPRQQGKK
jgi:hypothetical protein